MMLTSKLPAIESVVSSRHVILSNLAIIAINFVTVRIHIHILAHSCTSPHCSTHSAEPLETTKWEIQDRIEGRRPSTLLHRAGHTRCCSGLEYETSSRARLCTAMLVRRMVQLQKHLAPVISNSFCLSRQYSSGPDVREFMGKGLTALGEIERLSPYTDFNDIRLRPLLKAAKESFELALEVDKDNVVAMLWLARLHLYYNIPGACLRSGANLLETAAESGLADAQYELACRIRSEAALLGDGDAMDDRTFKYLESAACQKHAGALFLVGTMYLSGKHVRRDSKAAAWCFRKAAEQGYIPASTVYASLVSKGANWEEQNTAGDHDGKDTEQGMELSKSSAQQETEKPLELSAAAQFHFDKAAEAGDPLALEWLKRVPHAKEPENLQVS